MAAVGAQKSKGRRLAFGLLLLLLVDLLWVASSELTKYLFDTEDFRRPFFTTYVKNCMFVVYLFGFIVRKPWRKHCCDSSAPVAKGFELLPEEGSESETELGETTFEPLRQLSDSEKGSVASDNESVKQIVEQEEVKQKKRNVRFKRLSEVRRLPDVEAEAAKLSRLSYDSWMRLREMAARAQARLQLGLVVKIAFQFCFLWFLGNYAYQLALAYSSPSVVNVLSTSSTLFTLLLAALFPSSQSDRFSLSKACLLLLNIGGVTLICLFNESGDGQLSREQFISGLREWSAGTLGAIWALVAAAAYAAYLVFFRRATAEASLSIGMFFGFVGLFNMVIMWPGFYLLHATGVEPLQPAVNRTQAIILLVNGLLGTVLSEYLWLWGCLLTSSLLGTLSLSLVVPLTVISDAVLWKKQYPWQFSVGSALIVTAFVANALLLHSDSADPVLCMFGRMGQGLCGLLRRCRPKRYRLGRLANSNSPGEMEQRESLIA